MSTHAKHAMACIAALSAALAAHALETAIPFQAKIPQLADPATDSRNTAMENGTGMSPNTPEPQGWTNVTFAVDVYDSETSTTVLWSGRFEVPVSADGLVNISISDSARLAEGAVGKLDDAFGRIGFAPAFLEVKAYDADGAAVPVGPRLKVLPAPMAENAYRADRATDGFTVAGTLHVNGGDVSLRTDVESGGMTDISNLNVTGSLEAKGKVTSNGDLAVDGAVLEIADTASFLDPTVSIPGALPVGSIIAWPSATLPVDGGWALCDGREHNGVKTPDLRSRFIVGADDGSAEYRPGMTGGAREVTLDASQLPEHSHTFSLQIPHSTSYGMSAHLQTGGPNAWRHTATREYTTTATGGGAAHNNLPPYKKLIYIMRVK